MIAQLSGIDWNSEKLQKYVSESSASRPSNSSGTNSNCFASRWILWQMAQNRFSAHAPLIQRQVAAGEQVHRHVERLLGVVVAFQHVAHREVLIRLQQVGERLLDVVGQLAGGTSFSPSPDTPSTPNTSAL